MTALSGPAQVPVGTVVDATKGQVALTAAGTGRSTHSAEFTGGPVRIMQNRANGGLTQLRLAPLPGCGRAVTARIRRSRRFRIRAAFDGYFATAGRFASATTAGRADWTTTDYCEQTQVSDHQGRLSVATNAGPQPTPLTSGTEFAGSCLAAAGAEKRQCVTILSSPSIGKFAFGIFERSSTATYQLCIKAPSGTNRCRTFQTVPQPIPVSIVDCFQDEGPGTYVARWFVAGREFLAPLTFTATVARPASAGVCHALPFGVAGKEVGVSPLSGSVYLNVSGSPPQRITDMEEVPVGSIIDATDGSAEIGATNGTNIGQIAAVSFGEFRVVQSSRSPGAVSLELLGGDFSACQSSQPPSFVRQLDLFTNSSLFQSVSLNTRASVLGSGQVSISDTCGGSVTQVFSGHAVASTNFFRAPLSAGNNERSYCQPSLAAARYCLAVYGDPRVGVFVYAIARHGSARRYSLCFVYKLAGCASGPFARAGNGVELGTAECRLNAGPGDYGAEWRVGGKLVGIPLFTTSMFRRRPKLPPARCASVSG